ncbi:MAG: hypothetical protein LUH53_11210 [Lachnospiraceae bacterium]|nr:hypothetical protein [Lachnospiraceae bacterium]
MDTKITVIDSLMGTGKTSWAIQHINESPDDNFLYITPFLSEVDRIIDNTSREFREPINKGNGKLGAINEMLACQTDIASTHALFQDFNLESRECIRESHYTLILDEVLNVIEPYDDIKPDDMRLLQDSGCVTIDDDGFVIWSEDKLNYDVTYNRIKNLAINKSLLYINQKLLIWHYPPEIFSMFDKVYILTYMFDASILKYYFDLYKIDYDVKSIERTGDRYAIVDYFVPDTSVYRDKVNVYNGNLNDNLNTKVNGFSATWFKSSINKSKIAMLKNNLYNYFQNIMKAKSNTIMWTSFKESKSKLKGKGYSNCHVACNCRSTNEYADRYNLAYCVNIYLHPAVSQFFIQRGIEVDQDMYALSEMIQWIWRSRIRSDESINIYVPSKRMRGLLLDWLAVNSEEYRKVG